MADLARLQGEGGILKLLLHVALAKEAKVSALARTTTIRLRHGQIPQSIRARANTLLMSKQYSQGLLLGAHYPRLAPARGATALAVLDEQMGAADLVLLVVVETAADAGGVVVGHVHLELVGVGALWWLPSRFLGVGVEVVRQVLGVGDTDLPRFGQSGFVGPAHGCGGGGDRVIREIFGGQDFGKADLDLSGEGR